MASSSTAPPPPPKPVQLTRPLMVRPHLSPSGLQLAAPTGRTRADPPSLALGQPPCAASQESFKPAKIFQGTKDQGHTVASMAFDPQGETLLTCGSDHTLQLYSCKTGKCGRLALPPISPPSPAQQLTPKLRSRCPAGWSATSTRRSTASTTSGTCRTRPTSSTRARRRTVSPGRPAPVACLDLARASWLTCAPSLARPPQTTSGRWRSRRANTSSTSRATRRGARPPSFAGRPPRETLLLIPPFARALPLLAGCCRCRQIRRTTRSSHRRWTTRSACGTCARRPARCVRLPSSRRVRARAATDADPRSDPSLLATSQGKLDAGREPIVAFDNTGKVFAVAHNNDRRDAIHLFDSKQYEGVRRPAPSSRGRPSPDQTSTLTSASFSPLSRAHPQGSFDSFALIDPELAGSQRQVPLLTSLSFSPDGKMLLVGTADSVHYVLDAFDGHLLRRLRDFVGLGVIDANGKLLLKKERNGSGQEVCWSPDGRYVVSGASPRPLLWFSYPLAGADAARLFRTLTNRECQGPGRRLGRDREAREGRPAASPPRRARVVPLRPDPQARRVQRQEGRPRRRVQPAQRTPRDRV